jgi:hypothetical protein
MKYITKIEELQAGDVLVYERAEVAVTSVYRHANGRMVYTLGGNLTVATLPPSLMELPPGDLGELMSVRRMGSQLSLRVRSSASD